MTFCREHLKRRETMIYERYRWDKSLKAWRGPNGSVRKAGRTYEWQHVNDTSHSVESGSADSWEEAVWRAHRGRDVEEVVDIVSSA